MPIDWSSLLRKEDWWAVWIGFFVFTLALTHAIPWLPRIGEWTVDPRIALTSGDAPYLVLVGFFLLLLTSIPVLGMKEKIRGYWTGFPVMFFLAFLAIFISSQRTVKGLGLEYVLWALIFGLIISNVIGTPRWLKPGAKAELFIKIGLVLLGAEVLFHTLLAAGALAIFEVTVGLSLVWYFCYFLARRFGMSKSFASIMSSAVSICGVSAAIATGDAVKGDPKEISYTVSLVLLFAMPMLFLMPTIGRALNMPDAVVGAWIGGTIDTTPAVVAAGALYSGRAMQIASIVKMSQNVMIGVTAFLIAVYWGLKVERKPEEMPKPLEIWYRFPKFILGFIAASVVFSLLVSIMGLKYVSSIVSVTKEVRGWFFSMAFVSIGLDTKLMELVKIGGGKPLPVFLIASVVDVLLSLLSAYTLFGGLLFPPPL